jgi:hypothetical protein
MGKENHFLYLFGNLTTLAISRISGDMMINEFGATDVMRISKGNGNTFRKPAPVPLCPPPFHVM